MLRASVLTVVVILMMSWSRGALAIPPSSAPHITVAAVPQPQPFALTAQGVRAAMQRWIAAYDRHDAWTVLAYLSDQRLRFFDCDYAKKQGYLLTSRAAVQTWLSQRWARADHVQLRRIVVGEAGSGPGDPIRVISLEVHRTSRDTPQGVDLGFKLLPVPLPRTKGLIQTAALAGNRQCPLFKVD